MVAPVKIPGRVPSIEFDAQLRGVVRRDRSRDRNVDESPRAPRRRQPSRFKTYRIILDEDVPAATDPLAKPKGETDISKPNATILEWSKSEGKYKQSTRRLAVANHSDEAYTKDYAAWAVPQDGHYILTGCPQAVAERPTPPWSDEA